jgi:hypothetical protein
MIHKKFGCTIFTAIVLLVTACNISTVKNEQAPPTGLPMEASPPEIVSDTEQPTMQPPTPITPLLSTDLERGCKGRDQSKKHPQEGDQAIEFALRDVEGNLYVLSELLREKPVVLIFGSFT